MSKLTDLVSAIAEIQKERETEEDRLEEKYDFELSSLFIRAIKKTNREIKLGLDTDLFTDLVVVNFLVLAAQKKLPIERVERFVEQLKSESTNEQ